MHLDGNVMRLITKQLLADQTAERWEEQYRLHCHGEDKIEILEKLKALGEHPNPLVVDNIVGNSSWTRTTCHNCGTKDVDVVELGEDYDYESCTACVCKECISKSLALFP